jgi:hypothetical protein
MCDAGASGLSSHPDYRIALGCSGQRATVVQPARGKGSASGRPGLRQITST